LGRGQLLGIVDANKRGTGSARRRCFGQHVDGGTNIGRQYDGCGDDRAGPGPTPGLINPSDQLDAVIPEELLNA
jgi:hypothetical protein